MPRLRRLSGHAYRQASSMAGNHWRCPCLPLFEIQPTSVTLIEINENEIGLHHSLRAPLFSSTRQRNGLSHRSSPDGMPISWDASTNIRQILMLPCQKRCDVHFSSTHGPHPGSSKQSFTRAMLKPSAHHRHLIYLNKPNAHRPELRRPLQGGTAFQKKPFLETALYKRPRST